METNSREIEATLIIWSDDPQAVVSKIAGFTSIGSYQLLPQDSRMIHDLYLGMPDHALQPRGLALRIREIGAMRWITLKGTAWPTGWGAVERLEIEAPWSRDALNRVLKELADRGIKTPQPPQNLNCVHPLDVMANLGLKVIQDRENYRQVRNIVHADEKNGPILAEMVIDSVIYHFSGREIHHYEVEIEAKEEEDPAVFNSVIESLIAMCRPALRRWYYGKLTIGRVIENMLREGTLEGLINDNNSLKPIAYRLISYQLG